jgi:DNA-binding transcriptional ArsR family regulator
MSARRHKRHAGAEAPHRQAPVFAALSDQTRLNLLNRLGSGTPLSISRLTQGSKITRQAVTKHLRVLQKAGLIRGVRRGRENLFALQPRALDEAQHTLAIMSRQWDHALARLKAFVEEQD